MRIIKKINLMISLVVGLSVFADPVVKNVTAKQRYPWNGLVDITCRVTGIEDSVLYRFYLKAIQVDSGVTNTVSQFWVLKNGVKLTNYEVSANGDYRLLWDAKADLGEVSHDNMVVRITLVHAMVQLWEGGPYWATTNIGAENPEDYGYYFWWGDTVGYKRENNKWVASDGSNSNFSFNDSNTPTCYKSNSTLQSEGWITADGVLAPEHDAAKKHWGGDWRMPTKQEFVDLNNKCDWTWTTMNGVNGYIVKGRGAYASNSIFLPCAGLVNGTSLFSDDLGGDYWTSVPDWGYNYDVAWHLRFGSGYHGTDYAFYRYHGRSVRPLQGFTK